MVERIEPDTVGLGKPEITVFRILLAFVLIHYTRDHSQLEI